MKFSLLLPLLFCAYCLSAQDQIYQFQFPVQTPPRAADMDNDGHMDMMLHWIYPRWFRNQGDTTFQSLPTLYSDNMDKGAFDLADFDGDNDLDLLFCGKFFNTWGTVIIRNEQGALSQASFCQDVPGIEHGDVKWLDYDRDGDMDIFMAGMVGNTNVITLWNRENGIYKPSASEFQVESSMKFTFLDLENDGDLDLAVKSEGASPLWQKRIKFYRQTNNQFFLAPELTIFSGLWGCMHSADMNSDGFADIVVSDYFGIANPWPTDARMRIYLNNGTGAFPTFSDVSIGFPSDFVLADYDNNGVMDIIRSDSAQLITQVAPGAWQSFQNVNTGTNLFLSLGDFNHDQRLDLLTQSQTPNTWDYWTTVYNNPYPTVSQAPTAPGQITWAMTNNNSAIRFEWMPGSDLTTPDAVLRYNVRIGTAPGKGDIIGCDSDTTGRRLMFTEGNVPSGRTFTVRNLPQGQYWFSVQTIDGHWQGSPFTSIPFSTGVSLTPPGLYMPENGATDVPVYARLSFWSVQGAEQYQAQAATDPLFTNIVFDETGFPDTLIVPDCDQTYYYRVRAMAGNTISDWSQVYEYKTETPFTQISTIALSSNYHILQTRLIELNGDGHLDLAVLAYYGENNNDRYLQVFTYLRNYNGQYQLKWQSDHIGWGTDWDSDRPQMSWVDRNGDGDYDLFISGLAFVNSPYYANGLGDFFRNATVDLPPSKGEIAWFDSDNDNRPDGLLPVQCNVSLIHYPDPTSVAFTETPLNFHNCNRARIEPIDYDQDGLQDIYVCGGVVYSGLAQNEGGDQFPLVNHDIDYGYGGDTEKTDSDKDGDMDLIVSGFGQGVWTIRIYKNANGNFVLWQTIENADSPEVVVADYNMDGAPDLLLAGYTVNAKIYRNGGGQFNPVFTFPQTGIGADMADIDHDGDPDAAHLLNDYTIALYRNNEGRILTGSQMYLLNATPPAAPNSLESAISFDDVTLKYQADWAHPSNGAATSYNIRVGTTPGGSDVLSALSMLDSTFRFIPEPGNAGVNESFKLKNLPDGTYYWSVQSITAGMKATHFAPEQSFTIGSVATKPEAEASLNWQIFPNPATDVLNIRLGEGVADQAEIQILDVTGRLVATQSVATEASITNIDISTLVPGMYFVKLSIPGQAHYRPTNTTRPFAKINP
ncbi:MAG: VCBS repeat-containing protein [Saprospiraceae bacterium]|nr:VCBS repeat-containing protein [Saprospiraceae bacterium]